MMCADDNEALAGKAGAIEAVVSALQAHPGHVGAVTAACRALRNMSVNGELAMASVASLQCTCTSMQLR